MTQPAPIETMTYKMINGLQDIAVDYDAFILDIWGVLHDGIAPFAGTIECLENLQSAGKTVCLLSNTPDSSASIVGRLEALNIGRHLYQDLVTAGDSAKEDIHSRSGQTAWFAAMADGDFGHRKDLTNNSGVTVINTPDGADFVINDLYNLSNEEFEAVKPLLQIAADNQLEMICGNPDLIVNVGKDIKKCPGTYAAYYEQIGGKVAYHGKPHAPVYERAHAKLGNIDKSKIVAVGDSLHTDVQGANGYGIDCVFNIAGIHWEEIAMDHAPEEADLDKIAAMIDGQDHNPDYVLCGFKW